MPAPNPLDEEFPRTAPREIPLDGRPGSSGPRGPGWITAAALLVGLGLTLLFAFGGAHFFFLPIILPFGLGGGRFVRRVVSRFRRRSLRLGGNALQLVTRSPWGESVATQIDATGGVFVAISPSETWVNGARAADLRIVSEEGVLLVRISDVAQAEASRTEVIALLSESGIPLKDESDALAGGVATRVTEAGADLAWEAGSSSLLWGARRTVLHVGRADFSVEVFAGSRLLASNAGTGVLEAQVVALNAGDPFGTGVVSRRHALELRAKRAVIATLGAELSEPELHYVASCVADAEAHFSAS